MDGKYFTCEIHKQQFRTISALKEHVLQHHSNEGEAEAEQRPEVSNKAIKTEFQDGHHKTKTNLDVCEDTLNENVKLESNPNIDENIEISTATGDDSVEFRCHICSEFFSGESTLNRHFVSHLEDKPDIISIPLGETPIIKTEKASEDLTDCESLDIDDIDIKFQVEDDNTPEGGSDLRKEDNYNGIDDLDLKKEYNYNTIDKEFVGTRTEDSYKTSMNSRSKSLKSFKSVEKDANISVKSKHKLTLRSRKTLKFCCYFCFKYYSFKTDLESHIYTHTLERPFKCEICQDSFQGGSILRRHLQTHSDQRPYACKECNVAFKRPEGLRKHMQSLAHTTESPFKCKICSKSYRRKDVLATHMHSHKAKGTKLKPDTIDPL